MAATAPATTLVFDLGGGTLDATVIRIDGNQFRVLACGGEALLGGIDWDKRLVDYVSQQFIRRHGVDPRGDQHAYLALENRIARISSRARASPSGSWPCARTCWPGRRYASSGCCSGGGWGGRR